MQKENAEKQILPKTFKPVSYSVEIVPNIQEETFSGEITIDMETVKKDKKIFLNGVGLTIDSAVIKYGEKQIKPKIEYIEEKEQISFETEEDLNGAFNLTVNYNAKFNKNMAGFYLSSYKTAEGVEKKMATTQFEPSDARRAFPCFDEPEIKATFDISLVIDKKLTGLSNMDVKETKEEEEKKTIKFSRTPIMSTYLVAFIVGELEFIETKTAEDVLIRCFTTEGNVDKGKYALDVSSKCLSLFTKLFKIPYPLPKLDLIAIPDFAAGAMENWGLVTYRLTALLFEEGKSSIALKQRVAYVVCHELAHQWFGNLVTMKWWSDLWLNEGFATWAGTLAVDYIHPEWDVWTDFVNDEFSSALSLDCLHNTHAIQTDVNNPHEISEIFDAISYSKGASVIRMLADYLGKDVFLSGICNYLDKYQYKNAETIDLWKELDLVSSLPVSSLMKEWTLCPGYPIVSVSCKEKELVFLQERFMEGQKDSTLWKIPLKIETEKGEQTLFQDGLLKQKRDCAAVCDFEFLKVNPKQTAFFRVSYTADLLEKLSQQCKKGMLSPSDRSGIISDLFALIRFSQTDLVDGLSFISFFSQEESFFVWSKILNALGSVLSLFWKLEEEEMNKLKKFCRNLLQKEIVQIGFEYKENEDEKRQLLRTELLSFAYEVDHPETVEYLLQCFSQFFEQNKTVHPNLFKLVLASGVKNGGEEEYQKVLSFYKKNDIQADQKIAALCALISSRKDDLIQKTLGMTLDTKPDALVRGQDVIYVFSVGIRNVHARSAVWLFIKKNWDLFQKRFIGSSINMLNHIVSCLCPVFSEKKTFDEFVSFFNTKPKHGIEMKLKQVTEAISLNIKMREKNEECLKEWLCEKEGKKKRVKTE